MADPNLLDLARSAVTLRGWRWMPGMLTSNGCRVAFVRDGQFALTLPPKRGSFPYVYRLVDPSGYMPDFSDPATLGCLLALVREAWSSPDLRARRVGQRTLWEVERWDHAQVRYVHVADGSSEVAALVAALEVSGG